MVLKYLNLNLWLGGKIWQPTLDFLKQENADILALQEVFNSRDSSLPQHYRTIEGIQNELNYEYTYFDLCFIKNWNGLKFETGNAILSRYPIISQNSLLYDGVFGEYEEKPEDFQIQPRRVQHAQIDIDGFDLNVFNTQGIWGTDGDDNERRIKMANSIVGFINDRKNVLLSGDFNVKEGTKTTGIIEKNLKDLFKNERDTSFNMKRKDNPQLASVVVDFIFASPTLNVISKKSPEVDISDHLPLIVEIEV